MSTTFENLYVFRAARDLMVAIYRATERFPKHELYGLTAQLRHASVSVLSNIAEGQGRLTFGEWRQLLSQARGSLYEVEAQCIAARALDYLDEEAYAALRKKARSTAKPLAGLIEYVRKREAATRAQRENRRATVNRQPSTPNAATQTPSPP